jgi:sterol desaturase/sphingolipid hydroxylase (fatty acid hydroxylase superfamily)
LGLKARLQNRILDLTGVLAQALVVPVLATFLGQEVFPLIFTPKLALPIIPAWILFILPFTLVDYLYYWNHRTLHTKLFWFLHQVHHTSEKLNITVTSRNSIWTPLFLVYVWFQAFLIYLTPETKAYLYGLWLMGALDMWRHSGWKTPQFLKVLGVFLILPEDHEWHHSLEKSGVNYGANLNIWDRLHGTYWNPPKRAQKLGSETRGTLTQELFLPWKFRS